MTANPEERPAAPDVPVLVVGAGPTGLLLACALRRRGVECLLVDAYDEPLDWDRATVVHPRSLQIFESLGVVDEMLAVGVRIRGCLVHADGELLAEVDYSANQTRYPFDVGLSQEVTEGVLTRYLEANGGSVTRGTRLVDLKQSPDRVTATLETGGEKREVSASWVVGCDGYHSIVRRLAGIAYDGTVPDSPWAVFDAGLDGWPGDWDVVLAFFDDPLVILTPLPGRRYRVYLRPESRSTDLEATAHAVLDRYAPGVTFTEVQRPTHFLCHSQVAERFRSGRVLLAGDAAHACSPTEGHGMNTGLQDAYNLGWKLAHVCRGQAGEVLLDSYEAERRPVAVRIVESGAAADAAQARLEPAERAVRNAQVRATFTDPDAVHSEAAAAAEVDRDYAGSAIVSGMSQAELSGPAAGKLLPATEPVSSPDREYASLHELVHRLGHTILVLGGPGSDAEVAKLRDQLDEVPGRELADGAYGFVVGGPGSNVDSRLGTLSRTTADRLGVGDLTVLVVRPDRYIGLRWDGPTATDGDVTGAVAAYFQTLAS